MPPKQAKRATKRAPSRRKQQVPRSVQTDLVTMRRSHFLSPLPTGNGTFTETLGVAHPYFLLPVRQLSLLYAEYRFVYFKLYVKSKVSTNTQGQFTLALDFVPTGASKSLEVASSRSRFVSQSTWNPRDLTLHFQPSSNRFLWYQCGLPITTPAVASNPQTVQFWYWFGTNNVNNGLQAGDLYCSYAVQFRSSTTNGLPAAIDGDFDHVLKLE